VLHFPFSPRRDHCATKFFANWGPRPWSFLTEEVSPYFNSRCHRPLPLFADQADGKESPWWAFFSPDRPDPQVLLSVSCNPLSDRSGFSRVPPDRSLLDDPIDFELRHQFLAMIPTASRRYLESLVVAFRRHWIAPSPLLRMEFDAKTTSFSASSKGEGCSCKHGPLTRLLARSRTGIPSFSTKIEGRFFFFCPRVKESWRDCGDFFFFRFFLPPLFFPYGDLPPRASCAEGSYHFLSSPRNDASDSLRSLSSAEMVLWKSQASLNGS